jgi:serine protease inhibitor
MRRPVVVMVAVAVLASACGEPPAPEPPVGHVAMKLTDSSSGFGLRLLHQLLTEPEAGNVFISPLSATILLAMAASAAQGETRDKMLIALGLDPGNDPSSEVAATIARLAQSDANSQLELAQAVWAQDGLKLNPAYIAKLRDDYRAQLANLDFHALDAPRVVNSWVDKATHHKISELVDRFDPSVVAFLASAIYFHALWRVEFKSESPATFHTFRGDSVAVPMMRRTDDVAVLTTPEYSAALLTYKGGRLSAVVLLPSRMLQAADFARFLTISTWRQVLGYLHAATGSSLGGDCHAPVTAVEPDAGIACGGTLVMPKFTLEYKKDLTKTLTEIGFPPFPDLPDFCDGCYLSDVVQKTYVAVDEKGTTAAAVTGGAMAVSGHIPMVVDHPFVFAVIDNATDAPLFLGTIGDLG